MFQFNRNTNNILLILIIFLFFLSACDKEVSITPPDPEPGNNTLFVTSNPEGYDIYINNRISGYTTPDTIPFLAPGDYSISLKHYMYNDSTMNVNLTENETYLMDIDFTSNSNFYATLNCQSNYDGADIYIDDIRTNEVTPAIIHGIYPGRHTVSLKKLGFFSKVKDVFMRSSHITDVYINLIDTTIWLVYNRDNSQLISNSLHCIGYNSSVGNNMWLGTDDAGVIDITGNQWMNYNVNNSTVPMNFISDIAIGENNKVIIGTLSGIALYENGIWTSINTSNTAISSHSVTDIYQEPTSYNVITGEVRTPEIFMLATEGGVVSYSQSSWSDNEGVNNLLPSRNLSCLTYQASFNSFQWVIGTRDTGVFIWDTYTLHGPITYHKYNTNFISNQVTAVEMVRGTHEVYAAFKLSSGIHDAIGMLYFQDATRDRVWHEINLDFAVINCILVNFEATWVATNNGLYKLLNRTQIAEHYTKDNSPLPSDNIYDLKLDRANNLWMATGKGLARYKLN